MIARVPLFGSMDYGEIAEITKVLYTRTFMTGLPIVRERRWRCDVHHCQRRGGRRDQPRAACASEGRRLLGEMALLEHRRHKHDVVAKTRCRVYVLDSTSLARLKRRHPEIMQHIRKMAEARALANEPTRRQGRKRKASTTS
jgi:voltage-gated potassium channel